MDWLEGEEYKEDEKFRMVKTENTDVCPFCACRDIFSGSWSPETCTHCLSVWFMGVWFFKKKLLDKPNSL